MPKYDFYAEVFGYEDGEVEAKNIQEATEKAKQEIEMLGLMIAEGTLNVQRRPKDDD